MVSVGMVTVDSGCQGNVEGRFISSGTVPKDQIFCASDFLFPKFPKRENVHDLKIQKSGFL